MTPEEWMTSAQKHADSWWPRHLSRLTERGGAQIDAPSALGGAGHEPPAPAPGTYVLEH